jgi:hypothetical protein
MATVVAARRDDARENDGFQDRVIQVRRVTKVVKGGKQLRFRAVVRYFDGDRTDCLVSRELRFSGSSTASVHVGRRGHAVGPRVPIGLQFQYIHPSADVFCPSVLRRNGLRQAKSKHHSSPTHFLLFVPYTP